jgi:hypothetical protein
MNSKVEHYDNVHLKHDLKHSQVHSLGNLLKNLTKQNFQYSLQSHQESLLHHRQLPSNAMHFFKLLKPRKYYI